MEKVTKRLIAAGLREMATFIENYDGPISALRPSMTIFPRDLPSCVPMIGTCEKAADGTFYSLIKRFSGGCYIEWVKDRKAVCKRIVTGTREIPATPERTVVIPAAPARTEEIVEWRCPDSLLNSQADDEQDDDSDDDIIINPPPPVDTEVSSR